ncbi:adenylyl-sulfate kinase [Prosthecobacter sp.]
MIWLFGLPSSGKTTLARALRDELQAAGRGVLLLDGDDLRAGLCADLGYNDADRSENLRRAAHMARLASAQGHTVICAFVTPKEHHRILVREILGGQVCLVHIDCPLEVCIARDVKGLYAKAAARQISGMTGTQDSFEPPQADVVLPTHRLSVTEAVAVLIARAEGRVKVPAFRL